jgi:hypothetical protein
METNQLILILGVLGLTTWAGIHLLGPFAAALAQRLRPREHPALDEAAVIALREELVAIQERLDFMERVIAAQRPTAPPPLLPAEREAQARVPTPV